MRRRAAQSTLNRIVTTQMQAALYSLGTLCRNPLTSGMTVAVIAVVLCLPMLLSVLLGNIKALTQGWDKGTQITLFLETDSTTTQINDLISQLESQSEIEKINFISPEMGLSQLEDQAGFTGLTGQLTFNPLPPVIEVFPSQAYHTLDLFQSLLKDVSQLPKVETAQSDLQWLDRLNGLIGLAQQAVLLLVILFSCTVLFVVANTIRIMTQARRKEIEVFKLVGATNRFIRRPFLYSGLLYGLISGIIAWILVSFILLSFKSFVHQLALSYQSSFSLHGLSWQHAGILILSSAMLGLIASYFAVNYHIRMIEPS